MSACPTMRVADRVRFLTRAMGVIFLMGWGAWFWPFDDVLDRQGTPLGADFSMFYVAGQVAADGSFDQLYNQAEHQRRLHALFPGLSPQFCLPFRYPPAVAWLLAPLSCLPYTVAWAVFTCASCVAFGLAIWLLALPRASVTKTLDSPSLGSDWRTTAIWATVGWPVALEVLIGGQASLFGLLIAVASCVLLQRDRHVAAGAILALSAYKPNVLALFAVGVAVRYPRVLLGAIPVVAAFVGLSCYVGKTTLIEFVSMTTQLASRPWEVETPFWKVHSLATWFEFVVPGRGRMVTLLVGFIAAVAIGSWWRLRDVRAINLRPALQFLVRWPSKAVGDSQEVFDDGLGRPSYISDPCVLKQSLALLLVVNALFNPYTPIYDLVLLAAAAWFAMESLSSSHGQRSAISPLAAQGLLAVLFFGPHLSQSLARPLGMQWFPIVLLTLSLTLASFTRWWHLASPEGKDKKDSKD